ncbi:DUF3152 domain-containing protein [Actinomadura sp. ATCC 31491]|uniref:DUF3152 domain-containing protein n=1 Tax=Actinomadura luzonensis TaxID=2805427 RepID=A0ABT0G3K5_9ACTN|nr:DUF3152 domain-containing protein [Actinomadura luzonensis]MCK2219186.1 DUF3152 domain-containing protein [Actinomadura luzonensis]
MPRFAPFMLVVLLLAAGCGADPTAGPPVGPGAAPSRRPIAPGPPRAPRPARPQPEVRPPAVQVPYAASGRYAVVPGTAPARPGPGRPVRYLVEVERGLPFEPGEFAAQVHRILNDGRGWARFQRVDRGPVRVRVALSSPGTTIRQCRPLRTGGELSCWNGRRSIINALRWAVGVPQYEGDLAAYRSYLISHEVGHGLGHGHRSCPGPGRLAPVMTQQSKSLGRCRPNPWPFPDRAPGTREPQTGDRRP